MPTINCEIRLDLSWPKECTISQIYKAPEVPPNPNANPHYSTIQGTAITGATFQVNSAKLYSSVIALSINDNIKLLENIKQEFKRTISWNKYRSEITTQPKNNNLDYLIDPTFRNINRLFALSFTNGNDDPTRNFFDKYNMPLVEIKDFNQLIGKKNIF